MVYLPFKCDLLVANQQDKQEEIRALIEKGLILEWSQ